MKRLCVFLFRFFFLFEKKIDYRVVIFFWKVLLLPSRLPLLLLLLADFETLSKPSSCDGENSYTALQTQFSVCVCGDAKINQHIQSFQLKKMANEFVLSIMRRIHIDSQRHDAYVTTTTFAASFQSRTWFQTTEFI